MKKRLLALILMGTLSATMMAGCGSSSAGTDASAEAPADDSVAEEAPADESVSTDASGEVDYSQDSGEIYMFISSPEYADAINTLIDEYKTVAPNVTVNYETTQNDYPTLLKAKINSGDVPDIFSSTSGMDFLNAAAKEAGESTADMVAKFQAGEAKIADYPVLYNNFFDFIDTAVKYGDDKPLETDLSGEEQSFAAGNTAFMLGQGAWVEADLLSINPDLNIGFGGYPVSADAADCQVVSGSDQALHVNKDSSNLQAVLDFVNWWYTSDYGQSWFTDVAGVVPPITSDETSSYTIIEQGKASVKEKGSGDLSICYSTDSFNQAFGEEVQAYISGQTDKDATCAAIEKSWHDIDGAAQ